jgi:ABC-2 type transport system permease protein
VIGWAMRRLPPGSLGWLTLHELRGNLRATARSRVRQIVLALVLLGYTGLGVGLGLLLAGEQWKADALAWLVVLIAATLLFTFMTTQSLLASQRTLYEAGDLDLLFSAPLDPRTVVSAKLLGIAGGVMLTFSIFLLPILLPVAVLGHPELLGALALLVALALTAACLGLGVTLALARTVGPRAARTAGQILAALTGASVFLVTQILNQHDDRRESSVVLLFDMLRSRGYGGGWLSSLPGRAAFGEPLAMLLLLGGALLLFALAGWGMRNVFLRSYRAGGARPASGRAARGGIARRFHRGLFATIFAKELRLLLRDPALIFQMLLRIVYLAPILLIAFRDGRALPLAPTLAFTSVVIAGQLVSSLAWLAASAEDAPDLLKVAPVLKDDLDFAKLLAAMALAAPLGVLLPIAIALETVPGALVTLAFTAGAGGAVGYLEVAHAQPAPRSTFQRRQKGGGIVRNLVEFVIAVILGLAAGVIVYFV